MNPLRPVFVCSFGRLRWQRHSLSRAFAGSAMLAVAACLAPLQSKADEEARKESMGPLVRFDPNAAVLKDVIAIHGDPTLGLTAGHSGVSRRIGTSDRWLVGQADPAGREKTVAVMELDRKIGECRLRAILKVAEVPAISPDGRLFFGRRDDANGKNWECFSPADNRALWTIETDVLVIDALFSGDGKQVAVLHGLGKYQSAMPSAVSWYDASSGKRLRRVPLPGGANPSMHADDGAHLAVSGSTWFVTRPSESDAKIFMIPTGAAEATALTIEGIDSGDAPQVRTGGSKGELVVFYDSFAVRVRRLEGARLVDLGGFPTPAPKDADATYPNNIRFSPDGKTLMVGRWGTSFTLPLGNLPSAKLSTIPEGAWSGDFTADGKFFVKFDDGGGRALEVASWATVTPVEKREHPVHCCPISEAGFSFSGDYIISSDVYKLMLWSKDGRLLAQLVSDQEDRGFKVNMQSAILPEGSRKIYAADGWNFLEWNLDDVERRLARKPLNVPRVVGKVVFNDRDREDGPAELMSLAVDATGENLVTATRSEVRFRSMKSPENSKVLPVPEQNIMMKPRALQVAASPLRVFLESSSLIYELDPNGTNDPSLLNKLSGGFDLKTGTVFSVQNSTGSAEGQVFVSQLGTEKDGSASPEDTVKMPKEWYLNTSGNCVLADGKGICLVTRASLRNNSGSVLAVVDWQTKQIVWTQEVEWEPRSAALSADGKRLIIGSSNKALYEFDFEKIRKGG